jgi:hypothetical protein
MSNSGQARVQSHEAEIYESIMKNLVSLIGESGERNEVEAIGSILDNLSALRDSVSGPYAITSVPSHQLIEV